MANHGGRRENTGGARIGSGRKPTEITLARDEFLKQQEQHAQDAFAFHVDLMNDKAQPKALRMGAAQIVMARVWGKETNNEKIDGALLIRIIRDAKAD